MTTVAQRWHIPMSGRDPGEAHRAVTPLELLYDLCFVVAVAQAGIAMHHQLAEGHLAYGVVAFAMVFFAIWWAWMNFTWFASAYDTDDVLYRLLTFVQIAGVLVIAAGVQRAFEDLDFAMMTVGYLIMRLGLVAQWLRAAAEHPERRGTALRYAIGIALVQTGWLSRLVMPIELAMAVFLPLVVLELAVPWWADQPGRVTPFHRGHLAERYGLFTIIVLGEVVLAASTAVQEAMTATGLSPTLVVMAGGALLLIGAMWWAYFKHDTAHDSQLQRDLPFVWGYGHYAVFASIAAVGAGLQVATDISHEEAAIGPVVVALTVAVPVVVYLLATGLVHGSTRQRLAMSPIVVGCVLLLAAGLSAAVLGVSLAVLLMGLVVAGLVGVTAYRLTPRELDEEDRSRTTPA